MVARQMIIASVAFGSALLLMGSATSMIHYHYRAPCNEQAFAESTSPDGQWAAAVMRRRRGEEQPSILHVNLRQVGEPIRIGYLSGKADEGEVFTVREDTADMEPTIQWSAPRELTIQCPRCRAARAVKRDEHWGPITLRYQLQP